MSSRRNAPTSTQESSRELILDGRQVYRESDWDDVDQWYNRVNAVTSPAANTANPAPLALITFAVTTILLQGHTTAWVDGSETFIATEFMVMFGGLVQLLAGMWEFRRNNMFAATALSSYGGFWMSYGSYIILTKAGVIPDSGPEGLAMAFSLAGLFNAGYFLCALGLNVALVLLFLFLAIFNFFAAAGQFYPISLKIAGYIGVWTGMIGLYISFAELYNEVWFHGRVVIPLGAFTWPHVMHEKHLQKLKEKGSV